MLQLQHKVRQDNNNGWLTALSPKYHTLRTPNRKVVHAFRYPRTFSEQIGEHDGRRTRTAGIQISLLV